MIKTNEPQDKAIDCAVSIQEYFGFVDFPITVKPFLYLYFLWHSAATNLEVKSFLKAVSNYSTEWFE